MDEARRWELATHEAGHVAAWILVGGVVKSVTIIPDGEADGRMTHRRRRHVSLDDDAIATLAGRAAVLHERRMRGEVVGFSLPEAAIVERTSDLADDEQVQRILRCFEPELRAVHFEELQIRTDLLVRSSRFRRLLEEIREMLLQGDTLSGRQCHRLARRVRARRLPLRTRVRWWAQIRWGRVRAQVEHTLARMIYTI